MSVLRARRRESFRRAIGVIILAACAASLAAAQQFYKIDIDQDALHGAVDFGFLNHPLEAADRVFVRDGHFYRVGADEKPNTGDDERVRFFGVNLVGGANFPKREDAERVAKRLRKLGVNLVRLHLMDRWISSDPYDTRSILSDGPYPTFKPVAVRRLRAFLDALEQQGIYCDLNLHAGYTFRPEQDGVPALSGKEMPRLGKPLELFFPRMVDLQAEYARKLIGELKLAHDPVLAMVEIDNESSLVSAWQDGSLDEYAIGTYGDELRKQWNDFLQKQYAERKDVERAWGMSLAGGDVPLVKFADQGSAARANDYLLFLAACDRAYFDRLTGTVHDASDALVPVNGTQFEFGGLMALRSGAKSSFVDHHFYVDHYDFPGKHYDDHNWRIADSSNVGSGMSAFLDAAAQRVAGMPYTVSEFNQPWPNRQGAEIDPTLAAFASFQDWDGLMHFYYDDVPGWDDRTPHSFALSGDPSKLVNFGQAAWMFRRGAVQAAQHQETIAVSREGALDASRATPGAKLPSGPHYQPEIALQHRVAIEASDSGVPSSRLSNPLHSDTGEMVYDRKRKVLTIAAPATAGVFGFVGTRRTEAGPLQVELTPADRGFASLLLTSLDGKPIAQSQRLLLSTPGATFGSDGHAEPARRQRLVRYQDERYWWTLPSHDPGQPSGTLGGDAPLWMERVESFVTIRGLTGEVAVYPLDGAGERLKRLPAGSVQHVRNGIRIHLQADGQNFSPWYEIVAGAKR